MSSKQISKDQLQAFVDDQLDAAGKSEVFKAIKADKQLGQEACELRTLTELVRHAYETLPVTEQLPRSTNRTVSKWGASAAALLLFLLGGALGWVGHVPEPQPVDNMMNVMYWDEHRAFQNTDLNTITEQQGTKKIIVHLNTSSLQKFEEALTTAEKLLQNYADSDRGAEIEVVANASAIRMLRAGYSPYSREVKNLQKRYINLTFLACKDAIEHIQELEGPDSRVELLPNVDVTPSALEHILNRLSEGWVYINV